MICWEGGGEGGGFKCCWGQSFTTPPTELLLDLLVDCVYHNTTFFHEFVLATV